MRNPFLFGAVAAALLTALPGCPDRSTTARPAQTVPMGQTEETARRNALELQNTEDLERLEDFQGFSGDESRFAFTVFSEAAGLHLMHVVSGDGTELEQRFQLVDEAATGEARAFLRGHGFTRKQGTLSPEVKRGLSFSAEDGKAKVALSTPEGGERVLYQGDPFDMPGSKGGVARVSLAFVAPSGRRIAARVEQTPVTEWGGIVGHLLIDVPQGGAR